LLNNAYWFLAQSQLRLGDHTAAAKTAARYAGLPRTVQDYHHAALLCLRCQDLAARDARLSAEEQKAMGKRYAEQAQKLMREAVGYAADSSWQQILWAWWLADGDVRLRDTTGALRLAQKAIPFERERPLAWHILGVCHYRAGQWAKAIAALENALKLHKQADPASWFFLAMAHQRQGDAPRARQYYRQAVQGMNQADPNLRRYRAEAEVALGIRKEPEIK
jgi:tetratricopeptide (TPR) repeat protein